ncbi:MAG: phycobiliprotein lyase [Cyanobacteriota bacterium]|nr:phycobiliprotein lyase [Cyanobacteriota bacterium]
MDTALRFFQRSCGRWRSRRSSHHLLHRRAEPGGSWIEVVELPAEDPRLQAIAALHGQDPASLVGGCQVRWSGSMAWDQEGQSHEGESVFGLIPTDGVGREGLLLRDRGYAETSPVAGRFRMEGGEALVLSTDYETMTSVERFSFAGPDVRIRMSTVEGLSNTASFCIETRVTEAAAQAALAPLEEVPARGTTLSLLGW